MEQFTRLFVFNRETVARQRKWLFIHGSDTHDSTEDICLSAENVLLSTEKRHIPTKKREFYGEITCLCGEVVVLMGHRIHDADVTHRHSQ